MAAVIEEFVIHVRITYLRRGLVRLEMPDGSRSYSRGDRCFEVVAMMLRWIIAAPALALWFVWYAIASIGHRKMHKREPFTGPGNYPRITPPSRPAPPRWPR